MAAEQGRSVSCWSQRMPGGVQANLVVYALAFVLTTLGIVYVQEAERKIPINYASRYRVGALARQSYLPFKARGAA
jgi:protein transport protein SEC61 subunit alpha